MAISIADGHGATVTLHAIPIQRLLGLIHSIVGVDLVDLMKIEYEIIDVIYNNGAGRSYLFDEIVKLRVPWHAVGDYDAVLCGKLIVWKDVRRECICRVSNIAEEFSHMLTPVTI